MQCACPFHIMAVSSFSSKLKQCEYPHNIDSIRAKEFSRLNGKLYTSILLRKLFLSLRPN